mgnify:FL=1
MGSAATTATATVVLAAQRDERPRCWRCNKEFAVFLTRPWHIDCPRCHAANQQELLHTP